mmetsp:Transcript_35396/g.100220  ORF Transcript_35396/g.100220 Transcript_35396/m.100220 type:complete len:536 (-) Transcript_35396:160-1767(-)|eukprot:CAMPEP_0117654796 /NCGR_PEP_ID=MMETSP0804-20121206/3937_1 /TAXON_ID=1074897 /ORGANISM="Tetraselmis astigmatica, Strain CCMP880" /LENGTH=535 /DNA_ID=CAMNT_0005461105 /DNA_START=44 /DNA_END=1651 /DNA_ORIENTATION=-
MGVATVFLKAVASPLAAAVVVALLVSACDVDAVVALPAVGAGPPSWASGGYATRQLGSNSRLSGRGEERSVELPLDHFSNDRGSTPAGNVTVRYWVDTTHFKPGGPAILSMGGEGRASGVAGGWVEELARSLGAAQVALEHRFYGDSMPTSCGTDSSCRLGLQHLPYLTVQQALADAAAVLRLVDSSLSSSPQLLSRHSDKGNGADLPWIAVGGSYSGALSAWFRQTYPLLVVGALSSSGVVDAILDYTDFDSAIGVAVGGRCGSTLRRLVAYADDLLAGSPAEARLARTAMMAPEGLADNDYRYMMADSFSMAVQYGHKTQLCTSMQEYEERSDHDLLVGFSNFTAWLWGENYAAGCFYDTDCLTGDPSRWEENGRAWRWQKCYEMAFLQRAPSAMASGSTPASMRSPHLTLGSLLQQCDDIFGQGTSARLVKSNKALQALHGRAHPNGTSNIFFSNFSDDPWHPASVMPLEAASDTLPRCYAVCDDCGHCMDLHQPQPSDPPPLNVCRSSATTAISSWLTQHAAAMSGTRSWA